jgi:glycerophosphoryl diester phosphodiesterase
LAVTLVASPPTASPQSPGFDLQSHAGGSGETTGESLCAFAKSLELGFSTVEFEIVITKDGQPLVWHDPTIQPAKCGDPHYPYVGKLVHDLTLAQIRMLDCGRPSVEFPHAEVLWGNNIETKVSGDQPATSASPQQFIDIVQAAVTSAGKVDGVEIQSFDWRTLPLVREAEPSIPLVALWNEQTWAPDSAWLAHVNPAVVGDPMIVGAGILSPRYTLVAGRPFVERAHSLGLKVIPWTVNDADTMHQQIADGVNGLITDYPTLLRSVLTELGMPLPPTYDRG